MFVDTYICVLRAVASEYVTVTDCPLHPLNDPEARGSLSERCVTFHHLCVESRNKGSVDDRRTLTLKSRACTRMCACSHLISKVTYKTVLFKVDSDSSITCWVATQRIRLMGRKCYKWSILLPL